MESSQHRWTWGRRDREERGQGGDRDGRRQASPAANGRPMFASAPRQGDGTDWVRDAITRTYK